MAGISGRWGKKTGGNTTGGRVGDGGAMGDKIMKPINKKDNDGNHLCCKVCKSIRHMKESCKDKNKEDNKASNNGEILRCISCDSKKHLLPHCPHSLKNMVSYVDSNSSNDKYSLLSMATNRSVAGRRWTEEYLVALGEKDRKKVVIKEVTNGQKFIFSGGNVCTAKEEVKAPVMIGNKRYSLSRFVVDTPIPLL